MYGRVPMFSQYQVKQIAAHYQTAEDWLQVLGTYVMSDGEKKIIDSLRERIINLIKEAAQKLSEKRGDVLGFKKTSIPPFSPLVSASTLPTAAGGSVCGLLCCCEKS